MSIKHLDRLDVEEINMDENKVESPLLQSNRKNLFSRIKSTLICIFYVMVFASMLYSFIVMVLIPASSGDKKVDLVEITERILKILSVVNSIPHMMPLQITDYKSVVLPGLNFTIID